MTDQSTGPRCPVPASAGETVQMAHGGGGRAMNRLIDNVFRPAFSNVYLDEAHDGAVVPTPEKSAMTTDSYVVRPLFFPGGDIGRMAVYGTVNDLAMCGARARFMTAGFILEEGLPLETLYRVVASMAGAARSVNIQIVTGDLKVVERGKGDGVYINTAGVGDLAGTGRIAPSAVEAGDAVILSGDVGRHGMAVMAAREDLGLETDILSDCAPVADAALELIKAGVEVKCLRDLTRGGLASALIEIAESAHLSVEIAEDAIAVRPDVRALCELLGLDPLYVANEGRFIAFVPAGQTEQAVALLRRHGVSSEARVIGSVGGDQAGQVSLRTPLGTSRVLDMLSGEQLPRIC